MMTNLFSTFDPSTNFWSMNWFSSIIIITFMPSTYWLIPSRSSIMLNKIMSSLKKEIKNLTPSNSSKGMSLMLISLFMFIMINNLIGLFPYMFTSTSHLAISLSLAMPLWLSFMIYGWINNTMLMFAHTVPQSTPSILMPFMVCIETISNLIRPSTLAIRLSANMIAGHLLLTLLGNLGSNLSFMTTNILIITQMLLFVLEISVSMIQAYVFMILTTLYSSEVN